MNYKDLKDLLRPHQWFKNILIFSVAFFAARLDDFLILISTIVAFISFCSAASAMYVFNDIMDAELDREHPTKKERPIAQGRITKEKALKIAAFLLGFSVLLGLFLSGEFLLVLVFYFLINFSYSLGLKKIILLDVFLVSIGYLLRVLAGEAATGIPASSWLLITVFLMALLISLGKRKAELAILGTQASNHRPTLTSYTMDFLDTALIIASASALITYILYTVEKGHGLVFTSIPAIYGILRYLQLLREGKGADPVRVFFQDAHLLASGIVLLGVIFIRLYF